MDAVIALVSFVAVWWALARFYKNKGKGAFIRHIVGFAGGFVALITVAAIAGPSKKVDTPAVVKNAAASSSAVAGDSVAAKDQTTAASSPTTKNHDENLTVEEHAVATLDLSPQQYAKRFNSLMVEAALPFRAKPVVTRGVSADSFKFFLNDHLGVIGSIDKKSGEIKGATLIANGDGTVKTGTHILLVAAATMAAGIPDGTLKMMGPELMALVNEANKNEKNGDDDSSSRIFNGVRLFHSSSEQMGNWFGVEAIQ